MARAHYLHVIVDPRKTGNDAIVAIFTVRHEMFTYIRETKLDMIPLEYYRLEDGKYLTYVHKNKNVRE